VLFPGPPLAETAGRVPRQCPPGTWPQRARAGTNCPWRRRSGRTSWRWTAARDL